MGLEFFNQRLYDEINEKLRDGTITQTEIRTYSQYIDEQNFYENYTPSENFMREFKDDINWQQYCMWHTFDEKFVEEMRDYIFFNELLCNHPNAFSERFYRNWFHDNFDKDLYLYSYKHPYNSCPKDKYRKMIGSVGQCLDNAVALRGMVKLELLYKYELKPEIGKWVERLSYTNPRYCK